MATRNCNKKSNVFGFNEIAKKLIEQLECLRYNILCIKLAREQKN